MADRKDNQGDPTLERGEHYLQQITPDAFLSSPSQHCVSFAIILYFTIRIQGSVYTSIYGGVQSVEPLGPRQHLSWWAPRSAR
jgi:hypothetical protein